jgi:hypothetical protein
MRAQGANGPTRDAGRYGELAPDGSVHFTCAACGGIAAVVRLVPAGTTFDMGPPIGLKQENQDGVAISRWFDGPIWQVVDPRTWTRIAELLAQSRPDPGALHAVHWELAPFWCRGCQQCLSWPLCAIGGLQLLEARKLSCHEPADGAVPVIKPRSKGHVITIWRHGEAAATLSAKKASK